MINDKLRIITLQLSNTIRPKITVQFGLGANLDGLAIEAAFRPIRRIRRDLQTIARWQYPKK